MTLQAWTGNETTTAGHDRRYRRLHPERRAARRLPIELDVTVEGAAHRFTAPTANVSPGGLFVLTDRPIPVGTHVLLAFVLPNGAALEVLGVVSWARTRHDEERGEDGERGEFGEAGESGETRPPGLGIAFFCLEPQARAALERFCEVREALY